MKESSFNYSLLKYVYEDMYKGKEFPKSFKWNQPENNLGQNKIEVPDDMKQIKPVIREMMNAKPDLAVIYSIKDANKNYLLFLECKFESNEKSYESCYRQCEIQGKIADFLCKNYL
ncbi:MAG TPA: hypothetical protein DCZ91_05375, partial [Lachnospiraceae bacterium]|nr:hypothetical protein [Lachnospiraceae bacterium]